MLTTTIWDAWVSRDGKLAEIKYLSMRETPPGCQASYIVRVRPARAADQDRPHVVRVFACKSDREAMKIARREVR